MSPFACLLACALAACARSETERAAPPPSAKLEQEVCLISSAIESHLLWASDVADCGALEVGAGTSAWQRARDCVLTAQRAGLAYKLRCQLPSYDSLESVGFAARGGGQPVLSLQRTSTSSAPWQMRTSLRSYACGDLTPSPDCDVAVGELCLACQAPRAGQTLCNETSRLAR